MPDLKGKVAIITGSSAGIGEATAKYFASLGCWLTLTGRNVANLERVAATCCAEGLPQDKVLVVPGDLTVASDVENVVQKTVDHFGKIDILVNNAGIPFIGSVETSSMEDFKLVWETNFNGPLRMMKHAMPYLRQTKGNVVNVSTASSLKTNQLIVPYSTSKVALDHLTQCAALENAPYGVRVNSICPGLIKTMIGKPPNVSVEDYHKAMDRKAADVQAIKRAGTPLEAAHSIAFLASNEAAFITGIMMPVDGGRCLISSISGSDPTQDALNALANARGLTCLASPVSP